MAVSFILNALGVLIVFLSVIFLAYCVTKFFGVRAKKLMSGKNITVIETASLGLDKQLHLIKVGEKFVLLSAAGKNITMLSELTSEQMGEVSLPKEEAFSGAEFKELFDKYSGLFQRTIGKKMFHKGRISTNDKKKTGSSLERIKELNSKLKTPSKYNGDDDFYAKDESKRDRK